MPQPLRPLIVWLAFILAESLQGLIRRGVTRPGTDLVARQSGVAIGVIVIFVLAWATLPWMRIRSPRGAALVGVLWAMTTLAFELGLGRLIGTPWPRIASDYDLAQGGLMGLGLLGMALAPWAALQLRRRGA